MPPGAGNAGFNLKYVAQQAGFNGLPHMEIVGIVAAVLMDREHAAGALGAVDHFLGFFAGHGYRLFAQHGFARLQRLADQRHVEVVGSGDYHDVDFLIG